jgi:hypothetical protein
MMGGERIARNFLFVQHSAKASLRAHHSEGGEVPTFIAQLLNEKQVRSHQDTFSDNNVKGIEK